MKQIEYTVKIQSPVAFSEKNNDSTLYTTKKYISGSAIRGCLASMFIDKNSKIPKESIHEDENFYDIFLSGKFRFLPAYPIGKIADEKKDEGGDDSKCEPFILPLSLMKHKSGNNIIDLSNDNAKIAVGYKKITGFGMRKGNDIYEVKPDTQIQLHIARSGEDERITGRGQDGHIFNYEYIQPGQCFKGYFLADDDELADRFIKSMSLKPNKPCTVYMGRSRQAQYGKCEFSIEQPVDYESRKIDVNKSFYLYAYTPYIPFTQWQRTDEIAKELLKTVEEKLRLKFPDISIETDGLKIFAANEEVGGYVNVWHMRRERKIAFCAGSLIQFKSNMKEDAINYLNEILCQGMGWRSVEGFGQFRLWQALSSDKLKDIENPKLKKPEKIELIADKVQAILQKRILIEVQKQAKHTADKVDGSLDTKHIFTRIEDLMNTADSKKSIKEKIISFKDKARGNLKKIYIGNSDLNGMLLEKKNTVSPYLGVDWTDRLKLSKADADSLKDEFKKDVFAVDESVIYRTFWLWFARHVKKNQAKKEQEKKGGLKRG